MADPVADKPELNYMIYYEYNVNSTSTGEEGVVTKQVYVVVSCGFLSHGM